MGCHEMSWSLAAMTRGLAPTPDREGEVLVIHLVKDSALRPHGQEVRLTNPDKGFSGCGLETIAGLKVALGLERVDLVGGNGRDDANEGIDDGSMLGQIEGRELLDMADVGHVPGIQQGFIV